jgi:hypothetical protein
MKYMRIRTFHYIIRTFHDNENSKDPSFDEILTVIFVGRDGQFSVIMDSTLTTWPKHFPRSSTAATLIFHSKHLAR